MSMLAGKVAIVTGASSGIGRAIALLFAAQGAAVVLTARREAQLDDVAATIRAAGGRAHVSAGDIRQAETHEKLVAAALREYGGLDVAINNAGTVGPLKPLAEIPPEDWQQTLATNLTAAYLGARSQIPALLERGGGAIVFTSSFVGTSVGLPGMAAYGTSKAGLMGLVKGITADYAAQNIRANALLPGGGLLTGAYVYRVLAPALSGPAPRLEASVPRGKETVALWLAIMSMALGLVPLAAFGLLQIGRLDTP